MARKKTEYSKFTPYTAIRGINEVIRQLPEFKAFDSSRKLALDAKKEIQQSKREYTDAKRKLSRYKASAKAGARNKGWITRTQREIQLKENAIRRKFDSLLPIFNSKTQDIWRVGKGDTITVINAPEYNPNYNSEKQKVVDFITQSIGTDDIKVILEYFEDGSLNLLMGFDDQLKKAFGGSLGEFLTYLMLQKANMGTITEEDLSEYLKKAIKKENIENVLSEYMKSVHNLSVYRDDVTPADIVQANKMIGDINQNPHLTQDQKNLLIHKLQFEYFDQSETPDGRRNPKSFGYNPHMVTRISQIMPGTNKVPIKRRNAYQNPGQKEINYDPLWDDKKPRATVNYGKVNPLVVNKKKLRKK